MDSVQVCGNISHIWDHGDSSFLVQQRRVSCVMCSTVLTHTRRERSICLVGVNSCALLLGSLEWAAGSQHKMQLLGSIQSPVHSQPQEICPAKANLKCSLSWYSWGSHSTGHTQSRNFLANRSRWPAKPKEKANEAWNLLLWWYSKAVWIQSRVKCSWGSCLSRYLDQMTSKSLPALPILWICDFTAQGSFLGLPPCQSRSGNFLEMTAKGQRYHSHILIQQSLVLKLLS